MSLTTVVDRGGQSIPVVRMNGRLYPAFKLESLKGVASFKARPDDVCVCAYPKSGTHWIWEVVRILQKDSVDVPVAEKESAMIEFVLPADLEAVPSPRAVNTHFHFEGLFPPKGKLVYVTRDPRDVAVSYFNHHTKLKFYKDYDGQWKDYFHLHLEGTIDYDSWFDYTKGWEKGIKEHPELSVFVTSYEAFQTDPMKEVKKLAEFLGARNEEAFLEQVIQTCSFSNMKETKVKTMQLVVEGSVMYRKGKVGDWKNWFTVAQSEIFNATFEKQMAGTQAYDLYSHTKQSQDDPNMKMK